jgi:hypothetical protein
VVERGTVLPRTVEELAAALPLLDETRLAMARAEAVARPIDYPLGSGQAEELALRMGLKPVIRQVLDDADRAREGARFAALGLVVEEAECALLDPGVPGEPPRHRPGRALLVGRDATRVRAAAACDREVLAIYQRGLVGPVETERATAAAREQGRLLGYPPCCVDAFTAAPGPRRNLDVQRRALERTDGRLEPRLNVLDLGLFHYLPWSPCAFDCARSAAWADAVAAHLYRRHRAFAERVDAALGAHRLVLLEDVQVSVAGRFDGRRLRVERAWPTARDRHPRSLLAPAAAEAAARAAVLVNAGGTIEVLEGALLVNGAAIARTGVACLFPFGAR